VAYPKYWPEYVRQVESASETIDPFLANAAARYRFASTLDGLSTPGLTIGTEQGYFVVTKLAFAYTSLEALERGLNLFTKEKKAQIIDFRVAKALHTGKFAGALRQIEDAAEDGRKHKVAADLEKLFQDHESGNVRVFVEGLRNCLFHGKFTPSKSGLTANIGNRNLILGLAEQVLLTTDDVLGAWVKSRR